MNASIRNFAGFGTVLVVAVIMGLSVAGCGNDRGRPDAGPAFESANPGYQGSGYKSGLGGYVGAAPAGEDAAGSGGSAERAIEEADIFKLRGGRLYAMSRSGGLSVVDVSVRDRLELLGRYRTEATPFEMYVQGDMVFALYADWGQLIEKDGTYSWKQSSQILALDATDPADIRLAGQFSLPGLISDSRIVGDVLYVVAYEDGYCWQCDQQANTNVLSLEIGDPAEIRKVDQLRIYDPNGHSWRRSVTVTDQRIYIAGPEWNQAWSQNQIPHSSIQVVDISDPGGSLVQGAVVEVAGQINSRWQMDEHEGVLRVISQPWAWRTDMAPAVETFQVVSSGELVPLGSVNLVLPRPESLRSVRFAGDRAYAITFQQIDPLFVIDLSDPANPRQRGELEIPGWVYHLEPRGDRLLGIGFDQGNAQGALHVSLFDVADPDQPAMLSRVNFGGSWSSLAEDQDRIHKAFTILDDLGLILVPYGGYDYVKESCGSWQSGVQLIDIDWQKDELKLRGLAPQTGPARRAFVHDARLFTISEDRVETFDIGNRDLPMPKAHLPLNIKVSRSLPAGDRLLRFRTDWWTDRVTLEVVSGSDPGALVALGSLDLAEAVFGASSCSYWNFYDMPMWVEGDTLTMVVSTGSYWGGYAGLPGAYLKETGRSVVAVIDFSDAAIPRLVAAKELPFAFESYGHYGYHGGVEVPDAGQSVVRAGDTLVIQRAEWKYDNSYYGKAAIHYEVIDIGNPQDIRHVRTLSAETGALGMSRMQVDGNTIAAGHWKQADADGARARFYLHRISLPAADGVQVTNVPGALLRYDADVQHALTMDFEAVSGKIPAEECYNQGGYYNWQDQVCTTLQRSLNLVSLDGAGALLLDREMLPQSRSYRAWRSEERFYLAGSSDYGCITPAAADSSIYSCGGWQSTFELFAVGSLAGQALVTGRQEIDAWAGGYPHIARAAGTRLVAAGSAPGSLLVIDAAKVDDLGITTRDIGPGRVEHIAVDDGKAYCSMGTLGLEVVDLAASPLQ